MRTAVVRVNVDPGGMLTPAQLGEGIVALRELADDLVAMPAGCRDVQLLIAADDVDAAKRTAIDLCARVFGIIPAPGTVTFLSRGTDDDARGVLSAFGLTGEIARSRGDDGFDVVYVTLRDDDLQRVPESRIHTALEASLNCEVHIRTG